MNINGNVNMSAGNSLSSGNVVIREVKPLDIETLLDVLMAATKSSVQDGSVSIGADLLMRMTRELIASKVVDTKVKTTQPQWQYPDNAFLYHGSPMNPLRYYPSSTCKTSDPQEMKTPGLHIQLCGAS